MLRYFRRIEVRAQELGNYHRKYLHGIDRHGRLLIDRLEESESFDRIHLRQPAPELATEMDAVLEAGRDDTEKTVLLGCYQAIQYLLMNIRSIDRLRLAASGPMDPAAVYKDFVVGVSEEYETLIREYLSRLLRLFLGDGRRPDFVVCIVGTRLHQDDIDLGIFDEGGPHRHALNRAIGKMAREMMRWTAVPDFYLSEHVGSEGYSVSIEEYRRRLDKRILDFVSVNEILSAHPIIGSDDLFARFKEEVHDRYYYRRRRPTREHEGFMRGLAGEIRSLLLWPQDAVHIRPKDDLLRLVNAVVGIYRTVNGIRDPDTWAALDHLSRNLIARRGLPDTLERHLVFVETFRHLYQQFAAIEEEIDLRDPQQQESLQQVADVMGYEDVGVIRSWEQLIVHYFEHVQSGREIVRALLPDIRNHIRSISSFSDWFRSPTPKGLEEREDRQNLAVDLVFRIRYFQGIKYWDELLEALESEDGDLLRTLIEDVMKLRPHRRKQVVEYYARWGHRTFFTSLRLLTLIGRKRGESPAAETVFREFNEALLARIGGTPDEIQRFSTVFVHYPGLVYEYLSMADERTREFLARRFTGDVWNHQVAEWRDSFCRLCEIDRRSSRYFKRAIRRVCDRHPEYLLYFGDPDKFAQITRGMLADLMQLSDPETQKIELISYYDIEFLRIGLATLQGRPLSELDAEFTEFADHFLQMMFDVCKTEVDQELGRKILTHDHLGIFVAGGHARGRAHQDDWDLIVLLHSDSEEMYEYASRIITHLNRAIIRCGLIPQYRLADHFGGYVTRFSELRDFLLREGRDAFIEMSQLVGARLIVGSSRLEDAFNRTLVEGCIHSQKDVYVEALAREIVSRHTYGGGGDEEVEFDVKECRGGLRDLEMSQLLWKVFCEIQEPIGGRFWDALAAHHPERRTEFMELKESYEFLNRLRDVYRLTVAPQNQLDPEQLAVPAEVLGYRKCEDGTAEKKLAAEFRKHATRVARKLYALIDAMEEC
jgi:hypothetical protein